MWRQILLLAAMSLILTSVKAMDSNDETSDTDEEISDEGVREKSGDSYEETLDESDWEESSDIDKETLPTSNELDKKAKTRKFFVELTKYDLKGHNATCHFCRISINRERKNPVAYWGCIAHQKGKKKPCNKTFCRGCLVKKIDPIFEDKCFSKDGCIKCRPKKKENPLRNCCCTWKTCDGKHFHHCFTYKRTLERHKNKSLKWVLKKSDYPKIKKDEDGSHDKNSCSEKKSCGSSTTKRKKAKRIRNEGRIEYDLPLKRVKKESDTVCYSPRLKKEEPIYKYTDLPSTLTVQEEKTAKEMVLPNQDSLQYHPPCEAASEARSPEISEVTPNIESECDDDYSYGSSETLPCENPTALNAQVCNDHSIECKPRNPRDDLCEAIQKDATVPTPVKDWWIEFPRRKYPHLFSEQ